ncbi:unnamed protein product [Penicillium manginii]
MEGCQHVKCLLCHTEFCYACGRLWPGCHCDQAAEVDNRNATILGEDRDLALAYVLAGMDRAAR